MRQGKVIRNMATLTDPPRQNGREIHALTRDQARALLDGTRGDAMEALYVTALGTGLRQGELLGLRWPDIDLSRGELTVRHSLQRFTPELAGTKRSAAGAPCTCHRASRLPWRRTRSGRRWCQSRGSCSAPRRVSRCTASTSPARCIAPCDGSGCHNDGSIIW